MAWFTFRLRPAVGQGFHFGRAGYEQETSSEMLPSDSLFAALIVAFLERYGDPAAFVQPWLEARPPFVVSSVFPYVGDIPLLPMPRLRVLLPDEFAPRARKAIKHLRYVSPAILRKLLDGQPLDRDWSPSGPQLSLQDGAIWLDPSERTALPERLQALPEEALKAIKIWKSDSVPRVTLDRASSSSQIYQMGRTVFAEECGLWFLADVSDWGDLLVELLTDLGDRGIGGERSNGYGAFQLGAPLPVPNLSSSLETLRVMTLSRYHPRSSELAAGVLGDGAAYELVKVGGWLETPFGPAQRRKTVRMIEVGSVLKNRGVVGELVDVRPDYDRPGALNHPVYRCGYALTVGVSHDPIT